MFTVVFMAQVQIRMPEKKLEKIDEMVEKGEFKSRSDAIRTIIELYEEKKKTRKFYKMLEKRSKKAEEKPEKLVPADEI